MDLPGLKLPTEPAQPIQPALPVTSAGGYTGPTPRSARMEPGLPSMGSPSAPAPIPSETPSYAPQSPSGAPNPSPGLPTAAQNLGLDKASYDQILDQMHDAPDPEVFRNQFSQLATQKQLLGTPDSIDAKGYHHPSGEQEDYYRSWTKKLIGYLTTPKELGGEGYTLPQARMVAVASARKKWPNVQPSSFASYASPQSGIFPKSSTVDIDGAGSQPEQEVGAMRAAKLDLARTSKILTSKKLAEVAEWAKKYKETAGSAANATDFAKFVVDQQVADKVTGRKTSESELDRLKIAKKELDLIKKSQEETGEITPQMQEILAAEEGLPPIEQRIIAVEKWLNDNPDEQSILNNAYKWFSDNADTVAVASALHNLY